MPLPAAASVANDSTSTASAAPAAPMPNACQDSDTGALLASCPIAAASNTSPPNPLASSGDSSTPTITAGTASSSPSTSVSTPIWNVVAPRLFSIAISAARARITMPAVMVR